MKDGQEASIWLDEFDELYDYHIPIWTQKKVNDLNTQIVSAIEQNRNVPPITFASETLLNHLNSELEYEITRMERRIKNEHSGAAQYFRSTYPKYICWMFLCRATIKKNGVTVSEVASSSGLTPNGVRSIFEDAIRKFNLLEASQYRNDQEYSEAIIRLASSIEIISPQVYNQTTKENLTSSYYTINFIYSNAEKWKSALIYIDEIANKNVKKNIIKQINYAISNLEEKQKFRLEDIKVEIKNHFIDYERLVSDRVSYLKEQSEIAKRLGIAKNTIEVQTFGNILSNVQTDSPFYLRGYEAINKEIELMEGRENKKAFIGGLMDLEQSKRVIEQDKTIERTKLIVKSALLNNNEFSAASVDIAGTKFTYKNYNKLFGIAILIGLIVGMFFVIISNEFRLYKINK